MSKPRIFVDFQNTDERGRIRLNTVGTSKDLNRLGLELSEGLRVILESFEFEADAVVHKAPEELCWVAEIDWDELRAKK